MDLIMQIGGVSILVLSLHLTGLMILADIGRINKNLLPMLGVIGYMAVLIVMGASIYFCAYIPSIN